MRVAVVAASDKLPQADVLALPVGPTGLPGAIDGDFARVAEEEELADRCGEAVVLYPNGEVGARRVVLVGLGPREEIDADALRSAAAGVARASERIGGTLAWLLSTRRAPQTQEGAGQPQAAREPPPMGPGQVLTNSIGTKLTSIPYFGSV